MQTDLIIGMASGYTWADLEPFAVSLRRSGYQGRCILITGYGPSDGVNHHGEVSIEYRNLTAWLSKFGIETYNPGIFIEHPSIIRGWFAAQVIDKFFVPRFVLCVDTKDVVFQTNPISRLEKNFSHKQIVVVSEMQKYGDGP